MILRKKRKEKRMSNVVEKVGNNVIDIVTKDAPKLMVGSGVVAGVGATVLCGVNTVKAVREVDDIKRNPQFDNCTEKELAKVYFKRLAPLYAPVVILSGASIALNVGGFSVQTKRLTGALVAATEAAEISRECLMSYKKHAKDILNEEQQEELKRRVHEEASGTASNPDDIIIAKGGNQLFRDSITGQYFWSTREKIADALIEFNLRMTSEFFISVDEWCDLLDIEHTLTGDQIGWDDRYMPMRIDYSAMIAPNGAAAVQLNYSVPPVAKYRSRY